MLIDISSEEKVIKAEADMIDYDTLLAMDIWKSTLHKPGNTDNLDFNSTPEALITSLYLPTEGIYGANISWSSSNRNVITNSGRVIRPRWDESSQDVSLTAAFSYGGKSAVKIFNFHVPADEKWKDPQHMPDREFFGEWNGAEWTVEGKLDYTNPKLKGIESAVKANNNYAKAKEELLAYMKFSRTVTPTENLPDRNTVYSTMLISNIHSLAKTKYYAGECSVASHCYKPVTVPIVTEAIIKGGQNTFFIASKYNECSEVLIASRRTAESSYRPQLKITVNGAIKTYEAMADATVRAGRYKARNYSNEPYLKVKMFGDFLGDETYKAVLKFDLGELQDADQISDPCLVLHCKLNQNLNEAKELQVIQETETTWEEGTVSWDAFNGILYNYNGIPTGSTWEDVSGSDDEYEWQMPRMSGLSSIAAEYNATHDENYAYFAIYSMMDIIKKKGGLMKIPDNRGFKSVAPEIRGGYPRALDAAIRLRRWNISIRALMKSRYMTPDSCAAILKQIYDTTANLSEYAGYGTLESGGDGSGGAENWYQTAHNFTVYSALMWPEFTEADKWVRVSDSKLQKIVQANYFPDGSYIEATSGYNFFAYKDFVSYKELLMSYGKNTTPEYDDLIHKAAYYTLLLRYPNGSALQWGDEAAGENSSQKFPEVVTWFNDHDVEFIDTYGKKGTEPSWTSKHFPDSRITIMRSDWSAEALYMFTHVRGGGSHSHADDNHISVMAHKRILLPDPGYFTYTKANPDYHYGRATSSHNTVEVDGINQYYGKNDCRGDIHNWVTNRHYDFLSQTSKSYSSSAGVPAKTNHRRTIVFVKPCFWIVSDLLTPEVLTEIKSYKQLWHMLPNANLRIDTDNKKIFSDFASGANIYIASADKLDKGVIAMEAMGQYDSGSKVSAKYGYFQRSNVQGQATFDTVLLPESGNKGRIDVDRIDLGVPASTATAIKFKAAAEGETHQIYYILDYEHNPANTREFDKYKTNGQMALIREDIDGNIVECILINGCDISFADGSGLLRIDKRIRDFSLRCIGSTLYINTQQPQHLSAASVTLRNAGIDTVNVNGRVTQFIKDGDTLVLA